MYEEKKCKTPSPILPIIMISILSHCLHIYAIANVIVHHKAIPVFFFVKRQRAGRFLRSQLPKNKQSICEKSGNFSSVIIWAVVIYRCQSPERFKDRILVSEFKALELHSTCSNPEKKADES